MSEYSWTDSDDNGALDTGFADIDGNGHWDLAASDTNGNGVLDAYQLDPNGNGVPGDEVRFDVDEDGVIDLVTHDVDENGVADAYAAESTGWQVVATAPQGASFGPTVMPMAEAFSSQAQGDGSFAPTVMPMAQAHSSGVQGESMQVTFARLLQTETDAFAQVQLANAIALANIRDLHDPWTS